MKIALVQCPAFGIDRPPIALGYLAAFMRKHGYEVDILDLDIDLYYEIEEEKKNFGNLSMSTDGKIKFISQKKTYSRRVILEIAQRQ